jgi:hypothetical protein
MNEYWFHIGMPKAGSTAVQYFLTSSLGGFKQRDISFNDASQSVNSPADMERILNGLLDNQISSIGYAPVVIKAGKLLISSSENYSYFDAENLRDLKASGVAVIREPASWVTSMATQDLLFSIPRNFKDEDKHFLLGLASPEDQLVELIRSYSVKYCEILEKISSWSNTFSIFKLIPYSSKRGIIAEISDELVKKGVILSKRTEVNQIRVSHDFKLAQIGLSVYLTARFLFRCSRTQSCKLSSLALSLDKMIYENHFSEVSSSALQQIYIALQVAQERYEELLRLNGRLDDVVPLQLPKFQVLKDEYSRSLVDSLISAKLGYSQVPDGFDPELYLSLNPEIDAGVEIEARAECAVDHYRRFGFLEARPVPTKKLV